MFKVKIMVLARIGDLRNLSRLKFFTETCQTVFGTGLQFAVAGILSTANYAKNKKIMQVFLRFRIQQQNI